MKKMAFAFLPILLLAGFILPDDSCRQQVGIGQQFDGPYVMYGADKLSVNYIIQTDTVKTVRTENFVLAEKNQVVLSVLTDEPGKTFKVKLKSSLENEAADYVQPQKMFVISDIEGNFRAFRKLLQSHNIIDSAYQWSFGNGHLVLTGDFVDRGFQQTEVLWLIYSLEEQAKTAGGHVHYVLGNHEIMNMNGDLRYLNKKYTEAATLLNQGYTSLLGPESEMGRWLRTKNVVERIGNIIFCHGGISQNLNQMNMPVDSINKQVRPFYGDSTNQYDSPQTETLYSDLGPFWYRGYYFGSERASDAQIDSTLKFYNVKHVATGHTVIADTISVLFDGRILNTDVHHAGGHIEAMYIEAGKYYRATSLGEKFLVLKN